MSFYCLLALFGLLSGITTVMFGFGGGFVVVPVLYWLLLATHGAHSEVGQAAMQIAVATSSCVMIAGSLLATQRHHRAGNLVWPEVTPWLLPIGAGAVLGAAVAATVQGDWLRWAFAAYLLVTIVDCLWRSGFIARAATPASAVSSARPLPLGIGIGAVAALLGVGGSVITVPLMRRRGLAMRQATAMANPLSVPVALAGTITFVLLGWNDAPAALGPWHAGFVDLRAFAVLALGAWAGIALSTRWIGRIPDALHARAYVAMLVVVLVSMLLG